MHNIYYWIIMNLFILYITSLNILCLSFIQFYWYYFFSNFVRLKIVLKSFILIKINYKNRSNLTKFHYITIYCKMNYDKKSVFDS